MVLLEEAVFSSDKINADKRINIYAYICCFNQYFCTKSLRHKQATNDKSKSFSHNSIYIGAGTSRIELIAEKLTHETNTTVITVILMGINQLQHFVKRHS